MTKVIHLIPYYAIGGVERAAKSMDGLEDPSFSFSVKTIFPSGSYICPRLLWNPVFYIAAIQRFLRLRPNILVVSLWRSYLVGIFVKLLNPHTQLVVFLHLPNHVHFLDSFLTRLSVLLATQVWADSRQTLAQRLPRLQASKARIISFVTDLIAPASSAPDLRPTFIFWGRIHRQKGLLRAVRIFAAIRAQVSNARFVLIGPDCGALESVRQLVSAMRLDHDVLFRGELSFSDICLEASNASFYLQTSDVEGMAMSVVEAMQLGLVPVVTPVGEIARYARHNLNAVVINDDIHAIQEILRLLEDSFRYYALRSNAIAFWQRHSLYRNDVMQACCDLLKGERF